MADAPKVEVLEEQKAIPAEKTPSCTREFFLRPPDWRYQAAMKYLQDERQGVTPVIPTDPYVQYTIRILRSFNNPHARLFLDVLAYDVVNVIILGVFSRNSAITADIENHIINGETTKDIVNCNYYVKASIFDLYSKIFFDLSGITAVHAWINDFLMEPERHNSNTSLLRSRLLSYYGGIDKGGAASITGKVSDDTLAMMKQISSNEQQKRIFEYVTKVTNMSNEDYIAIMESAVKSMTEKDFQEHMRDRDEAGSSSLSEMAEHLEEGIRAYSQKELETFNENGLDFVNQYTPVIIRKDTTDDGK